MMSTTLRHSGPVALALTMSMGIAACGSEDSSGQEASSTGAEFGPGCSAIPRTGAGSFRGMATAPVATAATADPVLKTLVDALTQAGLVDTLNSAPQLTVFAPSNDAFAKLPGKDLDALLADKPALTRVLTHHVVAGEIAPADLAGTHTTLAGDELTVQGSGEDFTVGKAGAKVICGDIRTANATVYLIDGVLMPKM